MNLTDVLTNGAEQAARTSRIHGVVAGLVTDNHDPEGRARVKVKFPSMADQAESDWAKVASPMAGKERGAFFLPEPGDEVLVAFEQGDINHPYVLGSLWNAEDPPPETNADGQNNIRKIRSRSGHEIILDDTTGAGKIEIRDETGANLITIDAAKGELTLTSQTRLVLKSPQIEIEAAASLKLNSSGPLVIKGAVVNIN